MVSGTTPGFCALILAGGKSSRMGVNKALLRQVEDGPTLIERVIDKVRQAGALQVFIVADEPSPYEFLGLPIVGDAHNGIGPLGGVIGGLLASPCERNLVVACDMPGTDPGIIAYMASLEGYWDVIVPRWVNQNGSLQFEPLHGIYSRSALPKLQACAASGNVALHACLQTLAVRYVHEEEFVGFSAAAKTFRNLNAPADWVSFTEETP